MRSCFFLPNLEGQNESTSMLMAFLAFSNWSLGMLPEESSTNTTSLLASCSSSARFPKILVCQGFVHGLMGLMGLIGFGKVGKDVDDDPRQASSND